MPAGPSTLALGVAERYGYAIAPDADSILAQARRGIDALTDDGLRQVYRQLYAKADFSLRAKANPPAYAGFAPSKVLTTAIFSS